MYVPMTKREREAEERKKPLQQLQSKYKYSETQLRKFGKFQENPTSSVGNFLKGQF
jgi:hypothetical protein